MFSGTPFGYGIGTVLGGRLADRLPPRRLCWAALGLLGLGMAVAFAFPSGTTFLLFYSLLGLGLGGGLALVASVAAGAQVLPRRVGTVGGGLTATYALGAVVQVPVVARLSAQLGWLGSLRVTGLGLLALAVICLTVMPPLGAPRTARHDSRPPLSELLRRRRLWTALAIEASLTPLGTYAFVNLIVFANGRGLSLAAATLGLVALAIGNTAGRTLAGVTSDVAGVDIVLAGILALDLAGAGLLAWGPGGEAVLAGALLIGLALGGGAGVMSRAGAEAAPDAPATGFGLVFAGYAVGALLGPLIGAETGVAPVTWLLLGLGPLLGFGLLAFRMGTGMRQAASADRRSA